MVGIPGNTKQMSLWYQNMYLLIKKMRKKKNQGGNTWEYWKKFFSISEYVITD